LADRILVMYEGRIVAEFASGEADAETLGVYMTGGGKGGGMAAPSLEGRPA
jgi:simple sugar transport system ATP-binding protein